MFKTKNLISVGIMLGLVATPLFSQDEVEEVVVTGTRITADGFEGVSPVEVVTIEEIEITGQTRIEDMLNQMPQIETSTSAGFSPAGASGTANLDLRGLGASRTLILLNGRRLQMGSIYDEDTDIGQMPVSLLERVDVLTGGASAVYGSDAMAGAVNFITREVEGVEISISRAGYRHDNGQTPQEMIDRISARGYPYPDGVSNDGNTQSYDVVMGTGNDRGHITMYARHAENDVVYNRDRAFAACALSVSGTSCAGSANTPVPHFDAYPLINVTASDELNTSGENVYEVGEEATFYGINFFGQLQEDGSLLDIGQGTGRYNYAAVAMLMLPNERDSMGAIGRYEVSSRFQPYFEVNYSSFTQKANIAESGTFGNDYMDLYWDNPNLADNPSWVNSLASNMSETDYELYYSGCATYEWETDAATGEVSSTGCLTQYALPAGVQPGDEVTLSYERAIDTDDDEINDTVATYSVTGEWVGVNTGIYKRNTEGGPRTGIIENDSLRWVIGARGELGINDFQYDVSYTYGRTSSSETWINDFNGPSIVNAIEGGAGGYDVFAYQGVTYEQAQSMGIDGMMVGENTIKNLLGFVTGTTSVSMPSAESPISLVAGFESRSTGFDRNPDYVYANGLALGFGGATVPIEGEINVSEFFGEISVPVIENVPGIQSLIVDAAYRSSDYDLTGKVDTSRLGLQYAPNDRIRVRMGFNDAEKVPSIASLYSPESTGLWSGVDACAGADPTYTAAQCALTGVTSAQYGSVQKSPANQYYSYLGGNPNLRSESAETVTLGVVVDVTNNLSASVDYWSIDITDAIGGPGAEQIIELCAVYALSDFCDAIHRGPTGNLWQPGSGVDLYSFNIGAQQFEGIDFSVRANFDVLGGTLGVVSSATQITNKTTQSVAAVDATITDCVGKISDKCWPSPEWRTRTNFNFSTGGNWSVGAGIRTMSGIENDYAADTIAGDALADMRVWLDVNASYQVLDNTTVRFSVQNVTDELPPILGDALSGGYGNTLAANYFALGQYWSLTVDTAF